ncbi:hypothetical protein Q5752_003467 [Cryptotrichosporon argae]
MALKRLAALSTCEISDALIRLGVPHGGLIPDLAMLSPTDEGARIAGPAYTVQMVAVADADTRKPAEHFVDACPAGAVLLLQTPLGVKSGCWGGLMSTAARAKGIAGAVIDGGCRDLREHRALGFPVFARHRTTLGPSTFTRVLALNVPLTVRPVGPASDPPFPDTVVEPGDYIVADIDGVVVVPQGMEDEVASSAERAAAVDEKVRSDLEAGGGVTEIMLKWRGRAP